MSISENIDLKHIRRRLVNHQCEQAKVADQPAVAVALKSIGEKMMEMAKQGQTRLAVLHDDTAHGRLCMIYITNHLAELTTCGVACIPDVPHMEATQQKLRTSCRADEMLDLRQRVGCALMHPLSTAHGYVIDFTYLQLRRGENTSRIPGLVAVSDLLAQRRQSEEQMWFHANNLMICINTLMLDMALKGQTRLVVARVDNCAQASNAVRRVVTELNNLDGVACRYLHTCPAFDNSGKTDLENLARHFERYVDVVQQVGIANKSDKLILFLVDFTKLLIPSGELED